MVKTEFNSSKNPEETFRFIASGDAMELFGGDGLIPGIAEVSIKEGGRKIVVRDSWGLRHKESVASAKPFSSLVFHIEPNPLLRLLVRSLAEEWSFSESGSGSLVRRTFSLIPRPWAGALLPLIEKELTKAIRKNNETLSFHLLLQRQKISKPLFT